MLGQHHAVFGVDIRLLSAANCHWVPGLFQRSEERFGTTGVS